MKHVISLALLLSVVVVARVAGEENRLEYQDASGFLVPTLVSSLDLNRPDRSSGLHSYATGTGELPSLTIDPATNSIVTMAGGDDANGVRTIRFFPRLGVPDNSTDPPRELYDVYVTEADVTTGSNNRPTRSLHFTDSGIGYAHGRRFRDRGSGTPLEFNVRKFEVEKDPIAITTSELLTVPQFLDSVDQSLVQVDTIATFGEDLYYVVSTVEPEQESGTPVKYTMSVYKYPDEQLIGAVSGVEGIVDKMCVSSTTAILVSRLASVHFVSLGGSTVPTRELKDGARSCVTLPNKDFLISTNEGMIQRNGEGDRVEFYRHNIDAFNLAARKLPAEEDAIPSAEVFVYRRNQVDVAMVPFNGTPAGNSLLGLFLALGAVGLIACMGCTGFALYGSKKSGEGANKKEYNPDTDDTGFDD